MATMLADFTQCVGYLSMEERTVDLLHANVEDTHTHLLFPPQQDDNLVHLNPCVVPTWKVTLQPHKRWGDGGRTLTWHFRAVLSWQTGRHSEPHGEDIDGLKCTTNYINFCEDCAVQEKAVHHIQILNHGKQRETGLFKMAIWMSWGQYRVVWKWRSGGNWSVGLARQCILIYWNWFLLPLFLDVFCSTLVSCHIFFIFIFRDFILCPWKLYFFLTIGCAY